MSENADQSPVSHLATLAEAAEAQDYLSPTHLQLVHALLELGNRNEAFLAMLAAAQLPGKDASLLEHLGYLAFGNGAHDVAHAAYKRVVAIKTEDAVAWYNLASSKRSIGKIDAAVEACDTALRLDGNMVSAALLRSEMQKQTQEKNHIDELKSMLAKARDVRHAISLHYALGKELDDLGDYDAAFAQFSFGASKRRSLLDYDVRHDLWKLGRIGETFNARRLAEATPLIEPRFGFIVGLPRSGTTLIERVLTGGASVFSNGETDNVLKALMDGSSELEKDIFARLAAADPGKVQKSYARRAGYKSDHKLLLEKLPFNYLYAGAIRMTMPNARIIVMNRVAADNLFAMYSTMFGAGYPFSYDLSDLAEYYIGYRKLMDHWRTQFPDQISEISYEGFVENPVQIGPKLVGHMQMQWDEDMIRVEKNTASSATASAVQVRRPIYKSAMGRAGHYRKHLGPLFDVLEKAGIDPFYRLP